MPALIRVYSLVAALSVFAFVWLVAGSRLPRPYRDVDGSAIGFAFVIYAAACVSVVFCAANYARVREMLRSRFKILFAMSLGAVITYFLFVSLALFSLWQAGYL
jgi:hypothetical protein